MLSFRESSACTAGFSFLCVLAEGFDVPQVVHTVVTLLQATDVSIQLDRRII